MVINNLIICCMSDLSEIMQFKIPDFSMPVIRVPKAPAESMYERLVKQIVEFEAQLDNDQEIGGRFVYNPSEGAFYIDDIGYWGPDMIIFHGKNTHNKPIQLIQHYTQLSILLTALPKESEKPRRIGFDLTNKLAKEE
jgi:hypothetical protein